MLKLTKPPYADTKVDAEKTQQDITQLLRKYGVSQINWNVNYDLEQVQLDFVIEYIKQEDQSPHRIAVRVKPPMFAATRRTWDPKSGQYRKQEMAYLKNVAENNDETIEIEYQGKQMPIEDAIRKHKKFLYKLKFVRSSVDSKVEFVYHSDDTGIYLKPYSAKAYMETLWGMFDHILLSSATFFDVETYLEDLGLDKYRWKLIDVPSSFDSVNGPIMPVSNLYLNRKNFETTTPQVIKKVDEIIEQHPNERGLVHCFSGTYRSAIMKESQQKERLITHDSFNRTEVLKNFTSTTEGNKVLVSVNMGEGVDLKDDLARFQIIVKAPFLPLGDSWIALHKERSDRWYKSQTIITLMQMAGRVVRSKEDYGITYIIDMNAWKLLEQNRKLLPSWFVQRMDAGEAMRKKKMDTQMDDLMKEINSP